MFRRNARDGFRQLAVCVVPPLVLALGVGIAITLGSMAAGWYAEAHLAKRLVGYRRQHDPITVRELNGFVGRPASGNAVSDRYHAVLGKRQREYLSKPGCQDEFRGLPFMDRVPVNDGRLSAETIVHADRYLASHAEWMKSLGELAAMQGALVHDYRHWRTYAQIRHDCTMLLGHGVDCLLLSALVEANRDRADGCLAKLEAAKVLNGQLLHEPFLVNVATALVGERGVLRVSEVLLAHAALDAGQLGRLHGVGSPFGPEPLRQAMIMERLVVLDYYYQRGLTQDGEDSYSFSYLSLLPLYVSCGKVSEYLDFVDSSAGVLDLPWHRQVAVAGALERIRGAGANTAGNVFLALAPPIGALTRSYHGYVEAARDLATRIDAHAARPAAGLTARKD